MCGCIHDEAKTLIATIDSRQHAGATRKCVRWSSSAARGWGAGWRGDEGAEQSPADSETSSATEPVSADALEGQS